MNLLYNKYFIGEAGLNYTNENKSTYKNTGKLFHNNIKYYGFLKKKDIFIKVL